MCRTEETDELGCIYISSDFGRGYGFIRGRIGPRGGSRRQTSSSEILSRAQEADQTPNQDGIVSARVSAQGQTKLDPISDDADRIAGEEILCLDLSSWTQCIPDHVGGSMVPGGDCGFLPLRPAQGSHARLRLLGGHPCGFLRRRIRPLDTLRHHGAFQPKRLPPLPARERDTRRAVPDHVFMGRV